MDNKEQETTPRKTLNFSQEEYEIGTEETNHSSEFSQNNPDIIVGRYLIFDSRSRRCYAKNNSSIEINTPRDGNHISKMVNAILGCASPNSVKEVISRSSLSRPRIPLPESPEPSFIPPPPPYPVSAFSPSPAPPDTPPPLVSMSSSSPEPFLTPRGPRQVAQVTPMSTPRQNQSLQSSTNLAGNDSPPYSPFPDSHFAQFDVPSPPVSVGFSPISNPYYSDGSEPPYSNVTVRNSPTTPTPSVQCYSQHSRNRNTPSRKVHAINLTYNNELSPSPNYRINSNSSS